MKPKNSLLPVRVHDAAETAVHLVFGGCGVLAVVLFVLAAAGPSATAPGGRPDPGVATTARTNPAVRVRVIAPNHASLLRVAQTFFARLH